MNRQSNQNKCLKYFTSFENLNEYLDKTTKSDIKLTLKYHITNINT